MIDVVCCDGSRQEILRRYYTACMELVQGKGSEATVRKLELVMNQAGVTAEICPAVAASLQKAQDTGAPAGAMVLPDGRVVTGKPSGTLGAASARLRPARQPSPSSPRAGAATPTSPSSSTRRTWRS